ncbi:MAG: tRNA (N6-isopentenyl adenosine(37)-C2)-methylthiotransferase MiaB [Patescibacteria group bacterium]
MNKTYKLLVLGCQMNKSDAERIEAVLRSLGYSEAKSEREAGILMVVACSVRQKGVDRIFGKAQVWNRYKQKCERREAIAEKLTMLTGCLALHDKNKLEKKFDFIFDIKNLWQLEKFLFDKETLPKDYLKIIPKYQSTFQAFLPIMTGCNNFCSYCIVPYVRGREVSVDLKDVLAQAEDLACAGRKEITLLGQNVNSYDPRDASEFSPANPFKNNFARLLWELNRINGLERLHFMTSHPKDMSDDLIQALSLPKLVNYLHLPVQSGSDNILSAMNRNYKIDDYLKIIQQVRKVKPGIAIGTDIIVGFPGETEKDFQETVDLCNKVKFDIVYAAQYSPRPQTASAKLENDVSGAEKKRRWQILQNLNEQYSFENNKKYLNKKVSVLIDTKVENNLWEGNSLEMKRVRVAGDENLIGKIVAVEVREAKEWILMGNSK